MFYGLADVQNATDQAVAAHAVDLVVDVQFDGRGDSIVNTFAGSADAYDPTSPAQPPIEGTNDGPVRAGGRRRLAGGHRALWRRNTGGPS